MFSSCSAQYRVTVTPVEKFFLWERQAGRQLVVRHPVGDSPLQSASIAGRAAHSRLRQAGQAARSTLLQCLPWNTFSSLGGRQGRQRSVQLPVGDSPITVPPLEKFFFFGRQAGQAVHSLFGVSRKIFFSGRQAGQAARSKASR